MSTPLPADYTIDYQELAVRLKNPTSPAEVYQAVVDAPFAQTVQMALLSLGITVLLLVNKKTNSLDRIALSNTEMAKGSTRYSMKKFNDIKIPLTQTNNILVEAVTSQQPCQTSDWANMFVPELTPEQARLNQASAGIGTSVIYPFARGAMIFSYYKEPDGIETAHHEFMSQYIKLVGQRLARQAKAAGTDSGRT